MVPLISYSYSNIFKKIPNPTTKQMRTSFDIKKIFKTYKENFFYCDSFNHHLSYLHSNLEEYKYSNEEIELMTITNYVIKSMLNNFYVYYLNRMGHPKNFTLGEFIDGVIKEILEEIKYQLN